MGKKESKHSNSEGDALFRAAADGARPLKIRDRHQAETTPPKKRKSAHRNHAQMLQETASTESVNSTKSSVNDMSFQRSCVTRKVMRELRRGKYQIQDEIDLHGCTRHKAEPILQEFIYECAQHRLACVRIVHGKGLKSGDAGPVIKPAVHEWLSHCELVLAFCPARQSDGGTGAVYVLLRT